MMRLLIAFERVITNAQPRFDIRAVIFDDDIRGRNQLLENVDAFRRFQIERHRPLVAVQILHIEAMTRSTNDIRRVGAGRHLDLDHVGAKIREKTHTGWARTYAGKIENAEMRQGGRSADTRHESAPVFVFELCAILECRDLTALHATCPCLDAIDVIRQPPARQIL